MKSWDIETIPNVDLIDSLPEPEVALGNVKDPEKISAKIAEAKQKQIDKMALSPFYGRICSFATFGANGGLYKTIMEISDAAEIEIVSEMLELFQIGEEGTNLIITWNGYNFDFPFVYLRAALLKIPLPPNCPSLRYWQKKFSNNPHCDMMQELSGWGKEKMCGLDEAGKRFLGKSKTPHDFTKFIELIKSGKGDEIGIYNLGDAETTYELYQILNLYLF